MAVNPFHVELELTPSARYEAIDVVGHIRQRFGDVLDRFQRVLYCSLHTTAGYFDQSLSNRLQHRREKVDPFVRAFQRLFPPEAGYQHDQMHLRTELSAEQRRVEPLNADAHLAFIGSGLRNCVTYQHVPGTPVFFLELDGIVQGCARTRKTSVLAYNEERVVDSLTFPIPVSRHAINSVNLNDARLGLNEAIGHMLRRTGVAAGRVDLSLDPGERAAALTVNEFETLLMRHDMAEVLRDPLRFMARQGRRMLRDPGAIAAKSVGYAKYDAVQVINELIDALGLSESAVERLVTRLMAFPASRLLRLKRSISLAVGTKGESCTPQLLQGRYQSPILIQWEAAANEVRTVQARLLELR